MQPLTRRVSIAIEGFSILFLLFAYFASSAVISIAAFRLNKLMAGNNLPANSAQLTGLAQKTHTGVAQLGAAIPVTMATAAQIQTDLDADFNAGRWWRWRSGIAGRCGWGGRKV